MHSPAGPACSTLHNFLSRGPFRWCDFILMQDLHAGLAILPIPLELASDPGAAESMPYEPGGSGVQGDL